jgi:hypothetical protein
MGGIRQTDADNPDHEGYHGIVTFSPFDCDDPYRVMSNISRLNVMTQEGLIEDWRILKDSFSEIEMDDGLLSNYEPLDLSQRKYVVSYKIVDNVGLVQTIKILVEIRSKEIVSSDLPSAVQAIPYKAYSGANKLSTLNRLNLPETFTLNYGDGTSGKMSIYKPVEVDGELVYLPGQNEILEYPVVFEADGEVQAYYVVKGDTLTWLIPAMSYTGGQYTAKALVGGDLAKYEMDIKLTQARLDYMRSNYSLTGVKSAVWDDLYRVSSRSVRYEMDELVEELRDQYGYSVTQGKAAAWDEWYQRKDDRYRMDMDIMLLRERLSYSNISLNNAKQVAWDREYAMSYQNELDAMYQRVKQNNPGATDTAIKEVAWDIQLRETANTLQKEIMNQILREVTASEPENIFPKAKAWDNFYNASTRKKAEYDRIIARVRLDNPGYNQNAIKRKAWEKLYEDYTSDHETLEVRINALERIATAIADSLTFNPSQEIRLLDRYSVNFSGIIESNVQVEWLDIEPEDLINNFHGKILYSDVAVVDELFGNQILRNVRITIQKLDINGIQITNNLVLIDPYDQSTIDDYLYQYHDFDPEFSAYKMSLVLTGGILSSRSYWELELDNQGVPKWRFASSGGINYDGSGENKIIITVRNAGYQENPIWRQDVIIDIPEGHIADRTVTSFPAQFGTAEEVKLKSQLSPEDNQIWTLENGVLTIFDAFKMVEIKELYVRFQDQTRLLDAYIDFGEFQEEFYSHEEFILTNGIVVGKGSNLQKFDIKVINSTPRKVYLKEEGGKLKKDIRFFMDKTAGGELVDEVNFESVVFNTYDHIQLPKYALVKFINNGASEILPLDTVWTNVDEYDNLSESTVATAKIGNEIFGYIYHTVELNLSPEEIDISAIPRVNLPDEISIMPYVDLQSQLQPYLTQIVNTYNPLTGLGVKSNYLMNVIVDDISFPGYKENGYREQVYYVNFHVGITTQFDTKNGVTNFEIRQAKRVKVYVQEMIAQSLSEQIVGSIYDKIDFEEYSRASVLFSNGSEEVVDLSWDVSNLRYNFLGGVYYVLATIAQGTQIEQTFEVPIQINPSQLRSIIALSPEEAEEQDIEFDYNRLDLNEDGTISRLLIEPFEGFVGLPQMVKAKFRNSEEEVLVYVEWSFNHIVQIMSIGGGEFTKANQNAAIATIYMLENQTIKENGEEKEVQVRVAQQSIEVDVFVYDRTIIEYQVSYLEEGDDFVIIDDQPNKNEYNPSYLFVDGVIPINPYQKAYSEVFDSPDFAYFRRAKIILNNMGADGMPYDTAQPEIVFELAQKNYVIYDRATGLPTNVKNLYTGRDVVVNLRVGIDEPSIAPDARVLTIGKNGKSMEARIMDMTYSKGLDKNEYFVDVYGVITEKDGNQYSHFVDFEPTVSDKLIEGKDYARFGELATYRFDEIRYDDKHINTRFIDGRERGKIGFSGGTARIYAIFGNEFGGEQTHIINIHYVDRTINRLFEPDPAIVPYYEKVVDPTDEMSFSFVFDPFKPYVNTTQPLGAGEQGYLALGSRGTTILFNDGTTLDLSSEENISRANIQVLWDDSDVRIRVAGGYYSVEAIVGEGPTEQRITYPVMFKSRKVKTSVDIFGYQEGFKGIFKDGAESEILKVYDFLEQPNLTKAIGENLFVNAGEKFRVYFEGFDDEYMEFTMGQFAGEPEGDKRVVRSYRGLGAEKELVSTFELATEEYNKLLMSFAIDPSRPLSYKGGEMRFYMTMPGFAMGEDGQQKATISVKIKEQYIATIRQAQMDNRNPASASHIQVEGRNHNAITYTEGDLNSYHITKPYYYITRGGVPMPDYIWIYVTTKEWRQRIDNQEATVTYDANGVATAQYTDTETGQTYQTQLEAYYVNAIWSGGSRGRVYVNYYDEEVKTTMTMDIDNQPYTFKFTCTPYIYDENKPLYDPQTDELTPIDGFRTGINYGPEDVILMPVSKGERGEIEQSEIGKIEVIYVDDDGTGDPISYVEFDPALHDYDKYGLRIKFSALDEYVIITKVQGGGTYFDNFNKWYFGDVTFGMANQYATMTLGGRGGQLIRWRFTQLSNRKWVNTNVPSLVSVFNEYTFPDVFVQYFSTGQGQALQPGVEIPLKLTNFRTPMGDEMNPTENMPGVLPENYNQNQSFKSKDLEDWYNKKSRKINVHTFTTAENQIQPKYSIALVDWGIDQYCAYPEDLDSIGGTIILAGCSTYVHNLKDRTDENPDRIHEGLVDNTFNLDANGNQRPGVDNAPDNPIAYLVNPDHINAYPNSPLSLDMGWTYPAGMGTGSAGSEISGSFYYSRQYRSRQNQVPEIRIKRGTRFQLHNLPLFEIYYHFEDPWLIPIGTTTRWQKTLTYVNWQDLDVYYRPNEAGWAHTGNPNDYGEQLGRYESNRYKLINTFVPIDTIYTLVANMPFPSPSGLDYNGAQVVVKLRIVP